MPCRRPLARALVATLLTATLLPMLAPAGSAAPPPAPADREARLVPATAVAHAVAVAPPRRVGSVPVGRCADPLAREAGALCGRFRVPFDRADRTAGTIALGFEWYPAARATASTVLAVQGGPGYSSTGSRDSYLELYAPLRGARNVLLVDLRGTGTSEPVRCGPLQRWTADDGAAEYVRRVGQCGRSLDRQRPATGGGTAPGSELYASATAARDVAALLRALRVGRIDLYGDSYGTFFAQAFLTRYPQLLRSVVLDAAYPARYSDPFYTPTATVARRALEVVCRRSPACHAAAPGSAVSRLGALAARLRARPVRVTYQRLDGPRRTRTVRVSDLVDLVVLAGSDSGVYRELDPAVRALLRRGDAVPLARLVDRSGYEGDSGPVEEFSAGSYVAVNCHDIPQAFPYAATPAGRRAAYAASVAALPARTFAPFRVREWVDAPIQEFTTCLDWPAPTRSDPPVATAPPLAPARLPLLLLSGTLDSLTPYPDAALLARQLGPSARLVLVENTTHVTALGALVDCVPSLVRQFTRTPARLHRLDASCARTIPEIRTLGAFPLRLDEAVPAARRRGDRSSATARRLASVASAVVGDAVWNWYYAAGDQGTSLRGGTWTAGGDDVVEFRIRGARWTTDTVVAGSATWTPATGRVRADVRARQVGGPAVVLRLAYDDLARRAHVSIRGREAGRPLLARVYAS